MYLFIYSLLKAMFIISDRETDGNSTTSDCRFVK